MARNSVDEILRFARLDLATVQASEVEIAIAVADAIVTFHSPENETDRNDRVEPLRKFAHAYLATAELYDRIGPFLGLTTPPKQILTTLGISIGTDFPTQIDLHSAFNRVATRYRELGMNMLKQLRPVTAIIEAGEAIE